MRSLRLLVGHSLVGPTVRYLIAGGTVGVVYLGIPVVLNDTAGVAVEATIPIAYAVAICLHFTLQRKFVFRHVAAFALSTRSQVKRYGAMACFQYPLTAAGTALLPRLLGFSQRDTFVVVTLVMSLTVFVMLRTLIFHGHPDVSGAGQGLAAESEIAQMELLGERRMTGQDQLD